MGLILGKIRQFGRDERGLAMILVAIMLPVIIGFALLAIDMSRAEGLHNDLQKGADAFAIAAAAELDGRSDAWVRAERAQENLVDNTTRFSDGGTVTLASAGAVTVDPAATACRSRGNISWCFLNICPADDATAINAKTDSTYRATTPAESRFVEVSVNPEDFTSIFPVLLGGGSDSFTVGATAVAGFNRAICDSVPMFMCNPFEGVTPGTGKSFVQAFADGDTYSREFRILKVDSNPGPGNFGLLDNDLTSLRDAFAIGTSGVCYNRTAVETKTGVTLGQVNAGLNVRFDIYSSSLKKEDNNPAYRPATNVRKGAGKTSNCNKFSAATDGSAMGFPPGNSYDSTKGMTSSTWNRAGYWILNHGGTMPTIASSSHPTSTTAPPSRYDVYKYEIAHDLVKDKSPAPSKETGVPACYKGDAATLTNDPDRRLIAMAVVNCQADQSKINGHTQLQPDAYVSVFLTNPIEKQDNSKDDEDTSNEKPISFEVVDVEGPLGNATLDKLLRDEAQLYR